MFASLYPRTRATLLAARGTLARPGPRVPLAALLAALCIAGCSNPPPTAPITYGVVFPELQSDPDWSREGTLAYVDFGVVCVSADGGAAIDTARYGIWTWDPRTDRRVRITTFGMEPAWSPDGSTIAFTTPWVGQIFLVDRDGANLRPITGEEGFFFPRWSPDGTRLCWCRTLADSSGVWVADATGSARRLVVPYGGGCDWKPGSPDTLVYAIRDSGDANTSLYALALSDGGKRRLYSAPNSVTVRPRCSPLNGSVAFEWRSPTVRLPGIRVLEPGQSAPVQVAPAGAITPAWSPDGGSLAFERYDWETDADGWNVLWSVRLDDRALVQLTHAWPRNCSP